MYKRYNIKDDSNNKKTMLYNSIYLQAPLLEVKNAKSHTDCMSKCDDFSSSQTNCDAINYWYLKMLFNFLLLLLLSSPCGLCCLFVFVVVIVFICLFSYETKECYLLESERTDRDLIDRDLHTINFASGQKFVKYFKNQRLCFYFDYWCCCCRC